LADLVTAWRGGPLFVPLRHGQEEEEEESGDTGASCHELTA
jgi:hypothetical protein